MATVRGGQRLATRLRQMAASLANGEYVRVGFLENARYPDGKPVAMIAAIHNYGAPRAGIPPRPFFSDMIARRSSEWGPALANLLLANNYNARRSLDTAGAAIAGQLRQQIIATNAPPLAPSTIRRKGFAKPLIDTSHMINSVDHEVRTR